MDNENDIGTLDAVETTTDSTTEFATDFWDNLNADNADVDTSGSVETNDAPTVTLSDGTVVDLEEMERGYLRQSDYTKKTQELSRQRDELSQAEQLLNALESDPQGTLDALQRHLLVDQPDLDDLDPMEAELKDHRQFIEQQRAAALQYEVEAELGALADQYGDFDWNAVLEFAVEKEIPDLEAALLLHQKQQERETARQSGNQKALAAKRGAPPVARGSRAQGQVADSTRIDNVMDAWNAAKRELGYE